MKRIAMMLGAAALLPLHGHVPVHRLRLSGGERIVCGGVRRHVARDGDAERRERRLRA